MNASKPRSCGPDSRLTTGRWILSKPSQNKIGFSRHTAGRGENVPCEITVPKYCWKLDAKYSQCFALSGGDS